MCLCVGVIRKTTVLQEKLAKLRPQAAQGAGKVPTEAGLSAWRRPLRLVLDSLPLSYRGG